jgi:NitT/TauT family transport system ATP-binding protein
VLTAQPARIKDEVIVPFPRPRDTIEVSATAAFGELKLRMWNVLEAEVLQARREHEGV